MQGLSCSTSHPRSSRLSQPIVSVQSCTSYSQDTVAAAVRQCFDDIGGLERFVPSGARVFCKVNLLVPAAPEQAVTTHPEIVRAVVREIRRVGGIPVVGDNPAVAKPRTALRKSGILAVLEEEGVEVADLSDVIVLDNPDGVVCRSFEVSRAVVEADVLLNLPKLKTHSLTYMTVALKNLFGMIPGTHKAQWHLKAQPSGRFVSLLADLYGAVHRHFGEGSRILHLCDGIVAMEGDGPGPGGTPRHLGAILASADAAALDRVACELAGLDPDRLVLLKEVAARALGEGDLARIRWIGAPASRWSEVRFKPASGSFVGSALSRWVQRRPWLQDLVRDHPGVEPSRCSSCRRCNEICPVEAISLTGNPVKPNFELGKCIRCYCCAEVCPEGAIRKQSPRLAWLARA